MGIWLVGSFGEFDRKSAILCRIRKAVCGRWLSAYEVSSGDPLSVLKAVWGSRSSADKAVRKWLSEAYESHYRRWPKASSMACRCLLDIPKEILGFLGRRYRRVVRRVAKSWAGVSALACDCKTWTRETIMVGCG